MAVAALASAAMTLGSAVGGYMSSRSKGKAQEEQLKYLKEERAKGQRRGEELYGEYLPAGGLGMDALQAQSNALLGGDYSQFQESPGYQFQVEQGLQASERGAAARGGLMSGGQMKELTRLGQGYANQDFGNWLKGLQTMTQQGTNIGMGGAGGIMNQYGMPSAESVGGVMSGIGTTQGQQQSIPFEYGGQQLTGLAQYLGQRKEQKAQYKASAVGPYGPQRPSGVY